MCSTLTKVERHTKAKAEARLHRQKEAERKLKEASGKILLEQELLGKRQRQIRERREQLEREEAEAIAAQEQAEQAKREAAARKSSKKNRKKAREKEGSHTTAAARNAEQLRQDIERANNNNI
ncbi:unnamed protein product, partial [Discosporangium mesarthrocarpum]